MPAVVEDTVDMTAVEVHRVVGTSSESWEAAAEAAVTEASRSRDDVGGMTVKSWTATVGDDGDVEEYEATVELAVPVD